METELKILFVEDEPTDVELAKRTLSQEGIHFQSRVVENETDFLHELEKFVPDIIISDYSMPQFDGIRALKIILEKNPNIPFILLTGSMNEKVAVECIKTGAWDYIIKEHITRLPFAVNEALEKKKIHLEKKKAELELKESEERFRTLYVNSTIGLYRTTPAGKIILANPALVKMLGYSSFEELAIRNLEEEDFEPANNRKIFLEQLEKKGEVKGLESAWIRKDRTILYIRVSARAIRDSNGKDLYYDGTVEDITERKQVEEAFKDNETKYRELVDNSPDAIVVYTEGKIVFVNNECIRLMAAVCAEDLIGQPVMRFVHPISRALVIERMKKVVSEKTVLPLLEEKFVRLDGSEVDVEVKAVPITLESKTAVQLIIRDITGRKKSEQKIIEVQMMLHRVINLLPVRVFWKDKDLKYLGCNEIFAKDAGRNNPEELLGKDDYQMEWREQAELYRADDRNIIDSGAPKLNFEEPQTTPGGEKIWLRTSKVPLTDFDGNTIGVLGTYEDITEHKHAEEALLEREKHSQSLLCLSRNLESAQTYTEVLNAALDEVRSIVGYQTLEVYLLTEDKKQFKALVAGGPISDTIMSEEGTATLTIEGDKLLEEIAETKEIVVVEDALTDERVNKEIVARLGLRTIVNVPIILFDRHLGCVGMCTIGDEGVRVPSSSEQKYLIALASHLAVSLDRIHLFNERKHTEEALHESEERYRLIAENTADTISVFDMNLNYTYNSPSVIKLLGYTPDELTALGIQKILTPNSMQIIQQNYTKELELEKSGKADPNRSRIIVSEQYRKDGTKIWVEGTTSFVRDPSGKPINILAISKNITDRKAAVDALKESEIRFRTLVEQSPFSTQIFNPDGATLIVNNAFNKMWNVSATDMETIIHHYNILKDEQLEAVGLMPYIKRGFMEEFTQIPAIFYNPKKTATVSQTGLIAKWVKGYIWPVLDEDGNVRQVVLMHEDITERKRAEEALRESEERYRNLYENAPIGLYRTTPDGKILLANRALIKMLGYSSFKELAERNLAKEGFEPSYERKQFIYQIENEGKIYNLEAKWICHNGNVIVVRECAKVIRETNGKTLYYDGTVEDITERKRAEEALRHSEERYRTLYEDNPSMYFTVDPAGTVLSVNQYGCEQLGYTAPELVGQSVLKVFHDEDKESALQYVAHCVKNLGQVFHWELRKVCPTGSVMWVKESARAIQETDGQIVIYIVCENINERKHTEEEIISQKNRFAQLFENSPIAIALLDDKDKFIHINKSFSALFGYAFDEIGDRAINDLIVSPEFKEEAKTCSDEAHSGTQISKDSYRRRKDGSLVYVHILAVPVIVNNKIVGLYSMYVDLTEQKKAEEELINAKDKAEEMNRLKSYFLANMSHELRTPLNGILGYAEVLSSSLDDPDYVQMAQTIYDSGKRLSETLNLILDLSKAETEKIEVFSKNISVISVVNKVVKLFAEVAVKKNLLLETVITDENVYAKLDKNLFERTINNLVSNAIKFTNKGKVTVEVGKEKDLVYIKIKDTGIGIPEDKIDLIWEEFRQVSEGMGRSFEGTGLGLTLSKRIIELMNGVITVESKVGVGSIFTVKFPKVTVIPKKVEPLIQKQSKVIFSEKGTVVKKGLPLVLCVEDDFVNRNIVELFLKNRCIVDTAGNGERALQLAAEKKYDLFLMDINLGGGMNGMDVVKELLKNEKYTGTPVIAVTAYAMGSDKTEFLQGGCTHYLSKPFQKNDILELVNTALTDN